MLVSTLDNPLARNAEERPIARNSVLRNSLFVGRSRLGPELSLTAHARPNSFGPYPGIGLQRRVLKAVMQDLVAVLTRPPGNRATTFDPQDESLTVPAHGRRQPAMFAFT